MMRFRQSRGTGLHWHRSTGPHQHSLDTKPRSVFRLSVDICPNVRAASRLGCSAAPQSGSSRNWRLRQGSQLDRCGRDRDRFCSRTTIGLARKPAERRGDGQRDSTDCDVSRGSDPGGARCRRRIGAQRPDAPSTGPGLPVRNALKRPFLRGFA